MTMEALWKPLRERMLMCRMPCLLATGWRGGVKPLEDNDVIDSQHPCWLHLNYTHPDSAQWLTTTPLLPNTVRDALAGESTRPRVSRIGKAR